MTCLDSIIQNDLTQPIIENTIESNIIQSDSSCIIENSIINNTIECDDSVCTIITEGIQGPEGPQGPQGPSGGTVSTDSLLEYQELSSVLGLIETQIFDFTNNDNVVYFINKIAGEGNVRGEWFLYINDVLKTKERSSVPDSNIDIPMFGFRLEINDNIKIKVKHFETSYADFSVSMNYHK